MSKIRCDSCTQDAVGVYTLVDFPDKPSTLCNFHGMRYLVDAGEVGLQAVQAPLSATASD